MTSGAMGVEYKYTLKLRPFSEAKLPKEASVTFAEVRLENSLRLPQNLADDQLE